MTRKIAGFVVMLFLLRFIKVGISILLAKKSLVGNCCLSAVRKKSEIINGFFKLEFCGGKMKL